MRVNSDCKFSQIVDGEIKITSQDGSSFIIVPFDFSVITKKRVREQEAWTEVLVSSSDDPSTSKIYFIALEALQLIVDKKDADQEAAVREAAYHGQIERLKALLDQGTISIHARSDAVLDAVNQKQTEAVKLLCENGPILADDQQEAFKVAIWNADKATLGFFLAQKLISPQNIREAFIQEAGEGDLEILQMLFNTGVILLGDQQEAFEKASFEGHADILEFFLLQESISSEYVHCAFERAASEEDIEIICLFFRSELISGELIDSVFTTAVENRQAAVITAFLQSGLVSERCLNQVFTQQKYNRDLLLRRYISSPLLFQGRLYVHPQDFVEYPAPYLAHVARYGLHPIVFFLPDGSLQPGRDAGGLSKEFLSKLMDHLLVKEVIEVDAARFPCSRQSNLEHYTQLGMLLSCIDRVNGEKKDLFFTGEIFDPRTYALLQLLAQPLNPLESAQARKQREYLAIAQVVADPRAQGLVNFLTNQEPSESDQKAVRAMLVEVGQEPLEEHSVEDLRQLCFESLAIESYYAPLVALLKGMSRELKIKILAKGVEMAKSLQGEINDQLLAKLELDSDHPVILQKFIWLKEKIAQELEDPEKIWIKKFLQCVTSQSVMPTKPIVIIESSDLMCHTHTCFNQLEIPLVYETEPQAVTAQERFIKNLEITMDAEGFGLT